MYKQSTVSLFSVRAWIMESELDPEQPRPGSPAMAEKESLAPQTELDDSLCLAIEGCSATDDIHWKSVVRSMSNLSPAAAQTATSIWGLF